MTDPSPPGSRVTERIQAMMAWTLEKNWDKIPCTTDESGGYNDLSSSNLSWWTNGLWGGIQWLLLLPKSGTCPYGGRKLK